MPSTWKEKNQEQISRSFLLAKGLNFSKPANTSIVLHFLLSLGNVMVRQFYNSAEGKTHPMQDEVVTNEMPEQLKPAGMTRKRQQYLIKGICEFCKEECWDLVCPPRKYFILKFCCF